MADSFATVRLRTPPVPRVVPESVFDAFGWAKSATLDWRRPPSALVRGEPVDGRNPPGLAFVMRGDIASFLPRELAYVHVPRLAREGEWVLAPYAIDDATDELFEQKVEPSAALLLAADRLTALVWGLHDWAHFHNHGPFTERAWTELQCDLSALVWLSINRDVIGVGDEDLERVRRELALLSRARFEEEALAFDEAHLAPTRVAELTARARA